MRIALTFILLLFLASFVTTNFSQADEINPDVLKRLSVLFVCNCNCGTQINPFDETQCPTAKVFRKEVEQMLHEGKTEIQIRDYYVAQFGESILRVPLKTGFSLTIWVIPFVALVVGLGGIGFLLLRWTRRNSKIPLSNGMAIPKSVESELYQEMVDRERKKYL